MQFGDPKPIGGTVVAVSLVATIISALVFFIRDIALAKCIVLFLSLEGTGFLAGAFSASGQHQPRGITAAIRKFFQPQRAVPVHYSPPLFYGGLFLLAVSYVIGMMI